MNRKLCVFALVLTAVLVPMRIIAEAGPADKDFWLGKDVDTKETWSFSNVSGDHWTSKFNGKESLQYDTVANTDEYIELQASLVSEFERVRLYKDKMTMNKKGSRFNWIEMAKGKWR